MRRIDFRATLGFFCKHVEEVFAIYLTVEIADMPYEEAPCLQESLKASVCSLLEVDTLWVNILQGEEAEGIHAFGGRVKVKDNAQW